MGISSIEPVGLSTSISFIPRIEKSYKVLMAEKAIKDKRKRDVDFLEQEENYKRSLPHWLGKKVNVLV